MRSSSPPPPPPGSRIPTFEELMKAPKVSIVRAVPGKPIIEPKYPPPSPEPTPEQIEAQRQEYLRSRCPLHLLAMQNYNQRVKEGQDQYKVISPVGVGQITCYGYIGDLHMIFWLAQPTSIEKVDKSASKYFCATVHELSPVKFHVPFVDIFPGDPYKLARNGVPPLPICCEICGLMNRQDFEQKAKELADRREQERLDSDNNDILVYPIKAIAQGPLGNCEGPILAGVQKISTSWDSNSDEGGVMDKTYKRKDFDKGDVMEETRKKKGKFVEGSEKRLNINVSQGKKLSDNVQQCIDDSTVQQMRCKDPPPQPQGGDEVQVEMDQMKVEEGMGHQEAVAQSLPPPQEYSMNVVNELRSMRLYMEGQFESIRQELSKLGKGMP
ncbi:hypothetical protein PIB30_080052 [Stylosanthes scabra]|uniref:Uncharacterized protein n=1 Tax=Stylosanthes scabra TaxID=79078 RepID=A0ABU6SSL4_9FABA|nr:hypothetical protein [Stylosanthes scabra]